MNKSKVFIVLAVVILLLSNFQLMSKLNNLESRINNISNNQSQILSAVNSQTGSVTSAINQMKEEQSLISPISFTVGDFKEDEVLLKFNWQVKELGQGTEVFLNYRRSDSDEYTTIKAEGTGNGFFEAEFWTPVVIEPEWQVDVRWSNGKHEEEAPIRAKEKEEKERILKYQNSKIDYFVNVKDNGITKSGNLKTTHLGNLGSQKYKPVQAHLYMDNKVFSINVVEFMEHAEGPLGFKNVYLKKYANNTLVSEDKLTLDSKAPTDGELKNYVNPPNDPINFDYLVLKVVYENGDTFEREVYRK